MSLTKDGWFDWAIRHPGPAHKVNGGVNPSTTFVGHSVVGFREVFYDIMNGPAQKSVHLFNPIEGPVEQLYPITAQCWSSGAPFPNNNGLSMELEGGPPGNESQPMTDTQASNVVRVLTEWRIEHLGGQLVHRGGGPVGMLSEHNQWFATACPSGRYPWDLIIARVNEPEPSPVPFGPVFALGNSQAGIELRPGQQIVFWVDNAAVIAFGDPEHEGRGRIAKLFGDKWAWLRMGPNITGDNGHTDPTAVWCDQEGD